MEKVATNNIGLEKFLEALQFVRSKVYPEIQAQHLAVYLYVATFSSEEVEYGRIQAALNILAPALTRIAQRLSSGTSRNEGWNLLEIRINKHRPSERVLALSAEGKRLRRQLQYIFEEDKTPEFKGVMQ